MHMGCKTKHKTQQKSLQTKNKVLILYTHKNECKDQWWQEGEDKQKV